MKERLALFLLLLLPPVALAPAWATGHLVSPGDGAALHLPLRAAVWDAYRAGELPSWNGAIFSGTPLLAAYRPGALYPPMALLAALPPFEAFQALVTGSLALAGPLLFLYVRRLGANAVGAFVAGMGFALGPYLVGHLDDAATVIAAPLLPLVLLAAEAHVRKRSLRRAAGLAASLAALLVAGSPEAARAGLALLGGRLFVAHLPFERPGGPSWRLSALALALGFSVAAPQLLPTLLHAPAAGRTVTGLASDQTAIPGLTGLVLRYVSHTPAPAFALAALPLLVTETAVRVLGIALVLCLSLQAGRGPLAAPGGLALVFDLGLAVLAGLSLSAQWRDRLTPRGHRLRAYLLFACLASAAALSVAAAALGPLPESLAGAVGVLAIAMILYFALLPHPDPVIAGAWLIPLTASFLLQPHGRATPAAAESKARLLEGTVTSRALEQQMGGLRGERILTLTRQRPRDEEEDVAFFGRGALLGHRGANGYDPLVPLRTRLLYDGMSVGGLLPGAFFRNDASRLLRTGVRLVQAPASALRAPPDGFGFGDTLDLAIEPGAPRFVPTPIVAATEVRLVSSLAEAVDVEQGEAVARITARLASGRDIDPVIVRAGVDTAEWAYDRLDVKPAVRHQRATVFESWPAGGFPGHRYQAILPLPARFLVDGLRIERLGGRGRFTIARLSLVDTAAQRFVPVALPAAFVSDTSRFREVAQTPSVRLYEVRGSPGAAYVVPRLRALVDDAALVDAWRDPVGRGIDLREEALATEADARALTLPAAGRRGRATVAARSANRLELRAEGPGLLVVAESWDPGWRAETDGAPARLVRVNQALMGTPLAAGLHRVVLRHAPRGFDAGLALCAGAAAALVGMLLTRG
ncbi:MAG TPA: hypothetical protein VFM88_12160 [Vicinamibacteria bacterium]|nr:hypothetical protein [Vicinamibacteria bacterium]